MPRAENTGILAGSYLSSKWPNRGARARYCCAHSSAEHATLMRSRSQTPRWSRPRSTRWGRSSASPASRCSRASSDGERANAQHNVGHLDRVAAIERHNLRLSRTLRHGQRFPRRRHPGLLADGRATARQAICMARFVRLVVAFFPVVCRVPRPLWSFLARGTTACGGRVDISRPV